MPAQTVFLTQTEIEEMLTPAFIASVNKTWTTVVGGDLESFSQAVYDNLFEIDPALPKTLFKHADMVRQRVALPSMVDAAIKSLDSPKTLVPTLRALGLRHSKYGCEEIHYDEVGVALVKTITERIPEPATNFDAKAKADFINFYRIIKDVMWSAQLTPNGQKYLAEYKRKNAPPSVISPAIVAFGAVAVGAIAFMLLQKK